VVLHTYADFVPGTRRNSSAALPSSDRNRDGKPDVVTADNSKVVSIWLGDGKGALTFKAQYPVGDQPWSIRVADLNEIDAAGYAGVDERWVPLED